MEEKHSSKDATDNAINIIQNNNLLLDATIETIKSARRILWLITTMVCLGFFFIYLWYFSWENARIVARNGICNIKSNEIKAKDYKGNLNLDTALISKYKKEAQNLENEISNKKYNLPLVGINISISDFSIGIMMVSTALLVWLYLYLNRLFSCLETLKKKKGWRIIISLLKFHFVIIGSHSEKYIKYISKTLILSLPLLSFLFLLSDIYDIINIHETIPLSSLAFKDVNYLLHIVVRLITQLILTILITMFALLCKQKLINMEKELIDDYVDCEDGPIS